MPHFAYMLMCRDGSIYVGQTDDVDRRLVEHNTGKGATWTARRRPVQLLYHESFATDAEAISREAQWKRWSKAKKLALAGGDFAALREASKRRIR
jgi:putative endonuclease